MTISPQAYPLWCAYLDGDTIRTGRVIAWNAPHAANIAPVVAFDDDGAFVEVYTVTGRLFLGDTRSAAESAAANARLRTCETHHEPMTKLGDHQWRCPVDGCLDGAWVP